MAQRNSLWGYLVFSISDMKSILFLWFYRTNIIIRVMVKKELTIEEVEALKDKRKDQKKKKKEH